MTIVSNRCFSVATTCKGDEPKAEFLAKEITNIIINKIANYTPTSVCSTQQHSLYEVTKSGNNYLRKYEDDSSKNSSSFLKNHVYIYIIIVGFVIDIIILIISVLIDKKVYTTKEITALINHECLAKLNPTNNSLLTATIDARTTSEEIHSLGFISINDISSRHTAILQHMCHQLDNDELTCDINENIIENAGTVKLIGNYEAIILVIQKKKDDSKDLYATMKLLDLIKVNILGYIYI